MVKLRDVNLRKGSFGMAGILLWKSVEILCLYWIHLVLVTSEDRYKTILKLQSVTPVEQSPGRLQVCWCTGFFMLHARGLSSTGNKQSCAHHGFPEGKEPEISAASAR